MERVGALLGESAEDHKQLGAVLRRDSTAGDCLVGQHDLQGTDGIIQQLEQTLNVGVWVINVTKCQIRRFFIPLCLVVPRLERLERDAFTLCWWRDI